MHTEVTTKTTSDTKLKITSDPGDNNMQPDKSVDVLGDGNNDRKKRMQPNDGKDYQNLSPRRNNNSNHVNRYNRVSNYNGNRQNRNGLQQQQH